MDCIGIVMEKLGQVSNGCVKPLTVGIANQRGASVFFTVLLLFVDFVFTVAFLN